MSRLPVYPLVLIAVLFAPAVSGCAQNAEDVANAESGEAHVTRWTGGSVPATTEFGELSFQSRDGHDLDALLYRASDFDPRTGPIWFVMHGANRDADRYISIAAPVAERYGALAIAIEFSRRDYRKGADYTLGVMRSGQSALGASGSDRFRHPDHYLYAEIESVFDALRSSLGGSQDGYYLFGHSAGAQFVHRLLTFMPQPRVIGAVAANAGWYTLPVASPGREHTMPYGLRESPVQPGELREFFATDFVVLLGAADTTTAAKDKLVRGTQEAQAQGETRLARGQNYFTVASEQAASLDTDFEWRMEIVPRSGHDARRMIATAGFLSFDPDPSPCSMSSAEEGAGLVITEILADPPKGESGDANGDGTRDAADDEFVEIVNIGSTPICLAGWTLGDAKSSDRHVFRLGRALEPGQVIVIFGGGVPTGAFDGAEVQWARSSLSLSNAGDVLTLRDGQDRIVHQVSWGDCAGQSPAADHWSGDLEVGSSIVRAPRPEASWRAHTDFDGRLFSPGLVTGDANPNG